jgi:hypothetical protein
MSVRSWVASLAILSPFLVYGVFISSEVLIFNSAIGLGLITVIEAQNLLDERHSIVVAIALAVHSLGSTPIDGRFIYGQFQYFDVLSHAAGVAALTVAIWSVTKTISMRSDRDSIVLSDPLLVVASIVLALGVGAGWEIIEFALEIYADTTVLVTGSVEDMIQDLMSGLTGGLIAAGWIIVTRPDMKTIEDGRLEWEEPVEIESETVPELEE